MRTTLTLAAMSLTLLFAISAAQADPLLFLDDPSTLGIDVIIADNAPIGTNTVLGQTTHVDLSSAIGSLVFLDAVGTSLGGAWGLTVVTGAGNEILADQAMHLNSLNVTSTAAGSIVVGFSETGFEYPKDPVTIRSEFSVTTAGTVSIEWGADANNKLFSGATDLASWVPNASAGPFGPGAFAATNDFSGNYASGPFSISQVVSVTHTGPGQSTSFDSEITAMPEPGTLALVGMALVGAAIFNRRRRGNKA